MPMQLEPDYYGTKMPHKIKAFLANIAPDTHKIL